MEISEWLDSQLSQDIWNNKYRFQNESLDEWFDRVSGGNSEIKQLIKEKKFIFGGRILANRGLNNFGKRITLSNCYVIPSPEDNLESIFTCASRLARTYSYGGGCGIDVSKLRPKGAKVNNAASSTTGTTSFMDFFSYVTGLIGQEGRRGALMLSIDCTHPDLEEFINLKSDLNLCTKANISVKVSDQFMQAVKNDSDWELSFTTEHETIKKTVKAKEIFKLLAKRNWEMAEPGILYWDRITDYNMLNLDSNFNYAGVNPCAEEPLPAGGSCLLGSLNLSEFVLNPFTSNCSIDFEGLEYATAKAVQALNQVLIEGMELHPLDVQRKSVREWRQIGLGTLGLGDMLIKLGITYGSTRSLQIIDEVFKTIAKISVETSLELAKVNGCYPMCNKEALVNSSFIQALEFSENILEEIKTYGLFNSQLLTCAPTGSIGTMLECSTGVEPNFAFSFNRRTISLNKEETIYKVDAKIVKLYKNLTEQDELPEYFISSEQINPIDRIKVQSILQKWIDASISSTINLPEETTIEQVYDIYLSAWEYGLKGVTIYRNNCQRQSILSTSDNQGIQLEAVRDELKRGQVIKADDNCVGLKRSLTTGCGSLHCEAFFDPNNGELRECYLSKGSTGGCNNFMIGLSRMISLSARGGIGIEAILDQLKSCGVCPSYAVRTATKQDTSKGSCCPVAVGNALKSMHEEIKQRIESCIPELHNVEDSTDEKGEECPNCHQKTLIRSGGCNECHNCGWSRCA